ncbi:MAG: hypothetical protein U9O20_00675 [Patescibacteria group bacterium]|nr:hypothetical protein [Patescibacteria group bacterium]
MLSAKQLAKKEAKEIKERKRQQQIKKVNSGTKRGYPIFLGGWSRKNKTKDKGKRKRSRRWYEV